MSIYDEFIDRMDELLGKKKRKEIFSKSEIPDKRQNKHTTTLKFKEDLFKFFKDDYLDKIILEVGTAFGHTTRMLSFIFKHVDTLENYYPNLCDAMKLNDDRTNIVYVLFDAYAGEWAAREPYNVVFVDCAHDYDSVKSDIENALKVGSEDLLIIFDDYGIPQKEKGVKDAVDEYIEKGTLELVKHIGEEKGSECREGTILRDWEGIICKRT